MKADASLSPGGEAETLEPLLATLTVLALAALVLAVAVLLALLHAPERFPELLHLALELLALLLAHLFPSPTVQFLGGPAKGLLGLALIAVSVEALGRLVEFAAQAFEAATAFLQGLLFPAQGVQAALTTPEQTPPGFALLVSFALAFEETALPFLFGFVLPKQPLFWRLRGSLKGPAKPLKFAPGCIIDVLCRFPQGVCRSPCVIVLEGFGGAFGLR